MPLTRRTAAPRPGPATVSAPTVESYWWKTAWRDDEVGRAEQGRAGPRPGPCRAPGAGRWTASGRPGAGAPRRWVGRAPRRARGRWRRWSGPRPGCGPVRGRRARAGRRRPARPSTIAMSPSAVTRPMIATGRPQRSQTSRTSSQRSGRTAAHIRSCDSEIITSNGSRPGSRRGIASRSTSDPGARPVGRLRGRAGDPAGAEVLEPLDQAPLDELEAGLDEQLLGERVADLDGRPLGRVVVGERRARQDGRAADAVAPGRRAEQHDEVARARARRPASGAAPPAGRWP